RLARGPARDIEGRGRLGTRRGLRPPSDASPEQRRAPTKPALEPRLLRRAPSALDECPTRPATMSDEGTSARLWIARRRCAGEPGWCSTGAHGLSPPSTALAASAPRLGGRRFS